MKQFLYQITLVLYIDGRREEHNLAPISVTNAEYYKKLEKYANYQSWDHFDGDFIDDYQNYYCLVINNTLLQNAYFKFKCIGEAPEAA